MMEKEFIETIIYKEDINGNTIKSHIEEYMLKNGVWALYGNNRETGEERCLQVGKSVNVGEEIIYDLACMHFLIERKDGDKEYINQFDEPCGFRYKSNQVREYLYPYIKSLWHSIRFVCICDKSDENVEKNYAKKNKAVYWRNGGSYGVKKIINPTSKRMQVIGDLFQSGGEVYSQEELIEEIEENLGYKRRAAVRLINDSVKEGFLYPLCDDSYTR